MYCSNKSCQTFGLHAADAFTVETWMKHGLQLPQASGICRALESDSLPSDLRPQASDVLPLGRVRSKGRPAAIGDLRQKKKPRVSASDSEQDSAEFSQFRQPVGIVKEFWGPLRGRGRFCQRLFQVLFEDGTKETLVAEDLLDGCAEPFEDNKFYANILQTWRLAHAKAPRPIA